MRRRCADDSKSNCLVCGKSFVHEYRAKTPVPSEPPPVTSHTCEVCGKSFSQAGLLTSHMKVHMEDVSPNCKVCGKSFLQHEPFSQHIRTHSVVEALHSCPICEQSFHEESILRTHMKTHKKDMQCQVCRKSFF
uniref:C2H2-type domain-containing protein n=1 Tax=Octopus bimaculoides TaxID=37653 RepID=A0A0L8GZ02_OCTBM